MLLPGSRTPLPQAGFCFRVPYASLTPSVEKELYEFFADDCRRAAEQADDPQRRLLLLKLAQQWLTAAQEHERPQPRPRSLARGRRNQQGRPSPKFT
jgi:hypothetical protein